MPELTYIIETADIDAEGRTFQIAADSAQRQALTERLGLLDLKELSATGRAWRDGEGPTILVEGQFTAEVVQKCVVTLEPVESTLDEAFRGQVLAPKDWETHRSATSR